MYSYGGVAANFAGGQIFQVWRIMSIPLKFLGGVWWYGGHGSHGVPTRAHTPVVGQKRGEFSPTYHFPNFPLEGLMHTQGTVGQPVLIPSNGIMDGETPSILGGVSLGLIHPFRMRQDLCQTFPPCGERGMLDDPSRLLPRFSV